jgi:hypothetical protein
MGEGGGGGGGGQKRKKKKERGIIKSQAKLNFNFFIK